jgi:hypothetical protein
MTIRESIRKDNLTKIRASWFRRISAPHVSVSPRARVWIVCVLVYLAFGLATWWAARP